MDRHEYWDAVYCNRGQTEVSWFQPRPETSLRLIGATGLDKEAAIVDVGGGASLLVDHLLDDGYTDLTVLDVSDKALCLSRERLGERAARVNWWAEDVTEFAPPRQYDIWHDRAVFHFLTRREDRAAYLAAARAGVRPGGFLIVAAFAPDGPEQCSGLPVARYSEEAMAREFAGGFELVETLEEDHRTPAGKIQPFRYCRFSAR
ncbi:MAG: trans-aconitate 2-methyltransferase [Sulfuricellaceae bacterium]